VIRSLPKNYPKLIVYLDLMENLTTEVKNVNCIGCNAIFSYLPYENIYYGLKEDSPFCVPCYEKKLRILVEAGQ
jgi:hypothetical protein